MYVFYYTGSGVTTDIQTSDAAKIMGISILPFIVVQTPKVFPQMDQSLGILLALILSVLLVIAYCLYQVLSFVLLFLFYTVKFPLLLFDANNNLIIIRVVY